MCTLHHLIMLILWRHTNTVPIIYVQLIRFPHCTDCWWWYDRNTLSIAYFMCISITNKWFTQKSDTPQTHIKHSHTHTTVCLFARKIGEWAWLQHFRRPINEHRHATVRSSRRVTYTFERVQIIIISSILTFPANKSCIPLIHSSISRMFTRSQPRHRWDPLLGACDGCRWRRTRVLFAVVGYSCPIKGKPPPYNTKTLN